MNAIINQEITKALENVHSASFGHIVYESVEKLPKYLGLPTIVKRTSAQVQLFYNYENAVNNRLEKQGAERTFKAQELPWGKWEIVNKLISHKGELYLRYYGYKGADVKSEYFLANGAPIDAEMLATIKAYKAQKKYTSNTQSNAGLDENQVTPKAVKVDNIISLVCGKCQYTRK